MRINVIRSILDGYEIRLSAQKGRNLNFVVCESRGNTWLFERLWRYFVHGKDHEIELDVEDGRRCDTHLMFVYENLDYYDLLDYFVEMRYPEDFEEITDRANMTFYEILGRNPGCGGRDFLKIEKYQIMIPKSLSANEATISYYALLAAIREKYRINYSLIIENFGRWGHVRAITGAACLQDDPAGPDIYHQIQLYDRRP